MDKLINITLLCNFRYRINSNVSNLVISGLICSVKSGKYKYLVHVDAYKNIKR